MDWAVPFGSLITMIYRVKGEPSKWIIPIWTENYVSISSFVNILGPFLSEENSVIKDVFSNEDMIGFSKEHFYGKIEGKGVK